MRKSKEKKRMAICISAYEPGGQSVVLEELGSRFSNFYIIDLYCTHWDKEKPLWIRKVYTINPWYGKYLPFVNKKFINQIKNKGYDIIHCHDSYPYMNALYRSNISYYVTSHGIGYWWLREGITSKLEGILSLILYKTAYSKARKVISISKYVKNWIFQKYGVHSLLVYNGVTKNHKNVKSIKISGYPILIYFGQISKRKGILDLVKAVSIVKPQLPKIKLLICGFGTKKFKKKVKESIKINNLANNIKIVGYVSDGEKQAYYAVSDAFVSASYWEGFGLPIVEAQFCHKVAFVRDCTAMRELVPDKKFRFSDSINLAKKISNYFLLSMDRMSIQRRQPIDLSIFNWDRAAKIYLKLYDS